MSTPARHNLSTYGALNWRGVPGLLLGGSVFTGKAGHGTPDFAAVDARVTLWDLHARYTPGRWDLSGVYARGTISKTDALNLTFAGNPTPVPSAFQGWYAQAAYQLFKSGSYALLPFARYESFNTAKRYASVPDGLAGWDVLVVAHGNSLRALAKHLEHISDADIAELNIPTGAPKRYTFDDSLNAVSAAYLGDAEAVAAAAAAVAAQATRH